MREDEFAGSFVPATADHRPEDHYSFFERILRFLDRENPLQPTQNQRASVAANHSEDKN